MSVFIYKHKIFNALLVLLSFTCILETQAVEDLITSQEHPENIIFFHQINYVLPYYQSSNPNARLVPDGLDPIKRTEFKGQLSLKAPLLRSNFSNQISLYIAYTQLSFWQIYTSSPYFRDTNYQPEVFLNYKFSDFWKIDLGLNHESNGRGNSLERSWNRGYIQVQFDKGDWHFRLKPWVTLFERSSIDKHNPDIVHFLGRSYALIGFDWRRFSTALEVTHLESGFKRGHQVLHINFKLKPYLFLYVQGFNGYGQNLIDYNRHSNGFGVGISLNSGLT